MRKLFTICVVALSICFTSKAQDLGTFEDGVTSNFSIDGWWEPERFVEGMGPSIMNNPSKTGLNTSEKCIGAVNNSPVSWWGNFIPIKLATPIEITEENKYLKFLCYRSVQGTDVRLWINGAADQGGYEFDFRLSEDATWEGVSVDLEPLIGQELNFITIIVATDWEATQDIGIATYCFDNFVLTNNPIPPGDTIYSKLDNFNVNFEVKGENDTTWYKKIDGIIEANAFSVIDNSKKGGINTSDKILQFDKSAEASWWQGVDLTFIGGLDVRNEQYKYLHVMVWMPEEALENDRVVAQLCARDFWKNENTDSYTIWDDEVGQWMDLVMNITSIDYMTGLTVRFDLRRAVNEEGNEEYINSPANTFYFDEIILNNDPMPRTGGASGLKNEVLEGVEITSLNNAINIYTSKAANVKVYNMLGVLVTDVNVTENTSINSLSGLYLVKAEAEGLVKTVKVLVK